MLGRPGTVQAAGTGWQQVAFSDSEVSLVAVNPYQQSEVVAVADGHTKITLDGGILWRESPIGATQIVFDPVHPNDIYAGTGRGVYHSSDLGQSWQIIGNSSTQVLSVVGLTINNDAIYTTETAGFGNGQTVMFRIDRSGATYNVPIPSGTAGALASDLGNNAVYAGTNTDLYRSTDEGVTWQDVAGVGQIGISTRQISARNGQIWQTAADGVYESGDSGGSWQKIAGYFNINEIYPSFGGSLHGLATNGNNAFFGASSVFYPLHEVYEADHFGVNQLQFPDYPNDVALGDGHLWVAGRTGLWREDGVVSNQAQVKRPVVIIPGVLGSWENKAGGLQLDPITHVYDDLLVGLRADGYVDGQTLFPFPYQWRQDNLISAQQLSDKLAEIRKICSCSKIDIIGHSMGGLVARAYIEGSDYHDDVENLIELGTPNAGSVEDYSIWEAGVSVAQDTFTRNTIKLFNLEAYENGFSNLTDFIRSAVPSVGQLLPDYSYINGRSYPDGYPTNGFLDVLNYPANVSLLKSRVHLHIVGSDTKSTLTTLDLSQGNPGAKNWPDGEILQKNYGPGDETVPIGSLTSLASASLLLDENHGGLAQHNIYWFQYLLGDIIPDKPTGGLFSHFMFAYVKSPVRLSITDPEGKLINDDVTQVDGAFYTGSNSKVQFISIPNPIDGNYRIKLVGKGSGKYSVGVWTTNDDPNEDSQTEMSGQTNPGAEDRYEYNSLTKQLVLVSGSTQSNSSQSTSNLAANSEPALTNYSQANFASIGSISSLVLSKKTAANQLSPVSAINGSNNSNGSRLRSIVIACSIVVMLSGIMALLLWLSRRYNQTS